MTLVGAANAAQKLAQAAMAAGGSSGSGKLSNEVTSALIGAGSDTASNLLATVIGVKALTVNENHRDDAVKEVEGMKKSYGLGASVLLMIINSTGREMTLVKKDDFKGHDGKEPLDQTIGPGQTDCGLHVHKSGQGKGDAGYAIYGVTCPDNSKAHLFVAWECPWGSNGKAKAYAEINVVGHWDSVTPKSTYQNMMKNKNKGGAGVFNGFAWNCAIGQTSSPIMKMEVSYAPIDPPLASVSQGTGAAKVSWLPVDNALRYRVYVDLSGGAGGEQFSLSQEHVVAPPATGQPELGISGCEAGKICGAFVLAEREAGITSEPSNVLIWRQQA